MQPALLARRPSTICSATRPWRRRRSAGPPPAACLRCAVDVVGGGPRRLVAVPLLLLPAAAAAPARPLSAVPPGQAGEGAAAPGRSRRRRGGEEDEEEDERGGGGGNNNNDDDDDDDNGRDDPSLDPLARLGLAVLRLYRLGVSPLLQPACRYQPTCSRYAIAAYRAHGGWRGTVLTTWRLARCAPWGRGGYDPPLWPPVGLERVFAYDAAAPVAVVLGVAGFVRLAHALLFE